MCSARITPCVTFDTHLCGYCFEIIRPLNLVHYYLYKFWFFFTSLLQSVTIFGAGRGTIHRSRTKPATFIAVCSSYYAQISISRRPGNRDKILIKIFKSGQYALLNVLILALVRGSGAL